MRALIFRHLIKVASVLFLLTVADHPPSIEQLAGYGELHTKASHSGCALDPDYELVHHTARRHLVYVFEGIAIAAGKAPETYSVELIRNRGGEPYINAMTCSSSRLIWVSVKAWEELHNYEPALALLVAHELAHGDLRSPFLLRADRMQATERHLFQSLTYRQQWEVSADQRAAEFMLKAGYQPAQIRAAARYILQREGAKHLIPSSFSHPSGWDRVALLGYYLERGEPLVAK